MVVGGQSMLMLSDISVAVMDTATAALNETSAPARACAPLFLFLLGTVPANWGGYCLLDWHV